VVKRDHQDVDYQPPVVKLDRQDVDHRQPPKNVGDSD